MNKFYFIILCFFFKVNHTLSQVNLFSKEENLVIENIYKCLDNFKNTRDIKYLTDIRYDVDPSVLSEGNRKFNTIDWEKKFNAKIKIALQVINERANYPNFNMPMDSFIVQTNITPPCHVKYDSVTNQTIMLDERCKNLYQKMINENERRSQKYLYESAVRDAYHLSIQNLLRIFSWSKYASFAEFERFVYPLMDKNIDTEDKKRLLKSDWQIYLKYYQDREKKFKQKH